MRFVSSIRGNPHFHCIVLSSWAWRPFSKLDAALSIDFLPLTCTPNSLDQSWSWQVWGWCCFCDFKAKGSFNNAKAISYLWERSLLLPGKGHYCWMICANSFHWPTTWPVKIVSLWLIARVKFKLEGRHWSILLHGTALLVYNIGSFLQYLSILPVRAHTCVY